LLQRVERVMRCAHKFGAQATASTGGREGKMRVAEWSVKLRTGRTRRSAGWEELVLGAEEGTGGVHSPEGEERPRAAPVLPTFSLTVNNHGITCGGIWEQRCTRENCIAEWNPVSSPHD
jgi:hypothetical protein